VISLAGGPHSSFSCKGMLPCMRVPRRLRLDRNVSFCHFTRSCIWETKPSALSYRLLEFKPSPVSLTTRCTEVDAGIGSLYDEDSLFLRH